MKIKERSNMNDDDIEQVPEPVDLRLEAEAAIANRVIQPPGVIVKLDVCKETGRLIAVPMLSDGVGGLADLDPSLDCRGLTWDAIVYGYTECAKRAMDDKREDEDE
jgi:hypothetical protein